MADTQASAPARAGGFVADLFPGYFALVMATGIIAIASAQQDLLTLAKVLYAIAAVSFAVLAVLTIARLVLHPRRLVDDLTHHATGFAFLTLVAGINVLGSASAVIHGWWGVARICWVASIVLWVLLLYPALVAVIIRTPKPPLGEGINGTWFLLTVSTESVAVLGALLLTHDARPSQGLEITVLGAFTLGLVLYLIVMTMLFLRWTFNPLSAAELQPPSWIAAGAVAITVLAGSNLLGARAVSPRLERLAPFIEGVVILAWATATFWFPVMIAIGVWRHVVQRVPLRYHPAYWALVFPIGMYSASTFKMIATTGLDSLDLWPKAALGFALAAWAAAFAGLLPSLAVRRRRSNRASG